MSVIYFTTFVSAITRKSLTNSIILGSRRFGYDCRIYKHGAKITPDDILITWNRHDQQNNIALLFESIGAKVFVFENPYIPVEDKKYFSLGIGYHNNINCSFPSKDQGKRFESFGITVKDWKKEGDHILVCTQAKTFGGRGLGLDYYAQPCNWDYDIIKKLKLRTKRKIVFRPHPKGHDVSKTIRKTFDKQIIFSENDCLIDDLINAHSVIVYTSNAVTDSVIEGIPCHITGPGVFLNECCNKGIDNIETPCYPEREKYLYRMAWNQFSLEEIESGFIFEHILR